MECYSKKQPYNDFKVKRLEYKEVQIELSEYQEQRKDASGDHSVKAPASYSTFVWTSSRRGSRDN